MSRHCIYNARRPHSLKVRIYENDHAPQKENFYLQDLIVYKWNWMLKKLFVYISNVKGTSPRVCREWFILPNAITPFTRGAITQSGTHSVGVPWQQNNFKIILTECYFCQVQRTLFMYIFQLWLFVIRCVLSSQIFAHSRFQLVKGIRRLPQRLLWVNRAILISLQLPPLAEMYGILLPPPCRPLQIRQDEKPG